MKAVNLEKLLPADIPPGERVLWFGKPEPVSLWRRAYRADWVGVWFAAATVWNFVSATQADGALAGFVSAIKTLGFGAAAFAILGFLAWLSACNTLYVITQRRLVIKSGIALPMFINIPFNKIAAANVRTFADGTGDVPLGLVAGERIPYLALWPSARPLRFGKPEPALRSVPNARNIAETLGRALSDSAGQAPDAPVRAPMGANRHGLVATAAA